MLCPLHGEKLMRGVIKDGRRWRAQYPGYVAWFDNKEDAEKQRQAWVDEFGDPVWGNPPEDLKGQIFGNLKVLEYAGSRIVQGKREGAMWLCKNLLTDEYKVVRADSLKTGLSKGLLDSRESGLNAARQAIEDSKVDGVPLARYSETPRNDNKTGFRGVSPYRGKYRARLTVKGKVYTLTGFKTPKDAYYQGRLKLEELYLPKKSLE